MAFALHVHPLSDQNIGWDEELSIGAVRRSFLEMTLGIAGDVSGGSGYGCGERERASSPPAT